MTEEQKNQDFEFEGIGLNTKERHWGEKRFSDYRTRYHIENISDLSLLSELVFREALQRRYKEQIEKYANSKTTEDSAKIPNSYMTALDENLTQMLELKKQLGLLKEDKANSFFDYLETLKKKFKLWREENQGTRQVVCPFCSKLFFLMIRTDKYEAKQPAFFRDRILANKALWKLYKQGKITKQESAEVLGTPVDYIDWLEEKIFSKDSDFLS